MDRFDISIIGAGVVGLAVARALSRDRRFANKSIVILEQEAQFGQHISSRNSEVIHAGIYYPADSLKARLCVRGKQLLYEYCAKNQIAHERCGKLIVAPQSQSTALENLQLKAQANGVDDLLLISKAELRKMEPAIESELALFSPSSGIIDSHDLMATLLRESEVAGVVFARKTRVTAIEKNRNGYQIDTQISSGQTAEVYKFATTAIVNCAGLFSDQIFAMLDTRRKNEAVIAEQPTIHFCKGDYFSYSGPAKLNHLVYPLPEANTVGLGIHATLDLGGQIRFGPDTEYVERLDYDIDANKKHVFADAIRQYLPTIKAEELLPAYAGIRPKLSKAGEPAADFSVLAGVGEDKDRIVHLLGIESPGLTASLAIAEMVAEKLRID